MSQEFFVGTGIISYCTFTADGSTVDPTNVYVQVMDPDDNVDEYQFGVDAEITQVSTGYYKFESVDLDDEGTWHLRWRGVGAYQCAVEGRFVGRQSPFF